MNLILLDADDFIATERVRLPFHSTTKPGDKRAQHIREILGAGAQEKIKIGVVDGLIGSGEILHIDNDAIELHVQLDQPPPEKLPLTILLALPRPKMLRRIFRTVAELGVRELIVMNTYKVEKSYWQSPALAPDVVHGYLIDGLQQARDTVLPNIRYEKFFKPFVEDRLPAMLADSVGLIAHPGLGAVCPVALNKNCTLAIGPEGGFTAYEIEKLIAAGMQPVQLGARILRVENALTTLVARLFT